MRLDLIFILLILTTSIVFAQDDVDEKKMIGFGCYFAGEPTKTVVKVTELLDAKKYKSISRLLKSGDSGEKFLATIFLEKLSILGYYELSADEKNLMEEIKNSHEKVSVCSGCTYFDKVSLKHMFSNDNFLGSNWWIEGVLNLHNKKASLER